MTTDTIPLNRITPQLERLTSYRNFRNSSPLKFQETEASEVLRQVAERTRVHLSLMQSCFRMPGLIAAVFIATSKNIESQSYTTPVISIEDLKRLAGSVEQDSVTESFDTDPPVFAWESCDYDVLKALEEFSSHTHGDY